MKYWRWILPALVALTGATASWGANGAPWPGLRSAAPVPTKLTYTDEPASGDFDLRAHYRVRRPKTWDAVLVMGRQDSANTYRLAFSPSRTTLACVRLGLEVPLASGPGAGSAPAGEVLLRRRGAAIEFYVGRRLLVSACDETFTEGGVAYGSANASVTFDQVRLQPVQPITFTDDFMRTDKEESEWEPVAGAWGVKSLQNPTRSANAFTYLGRAAKEPAVSVTGAWFWSDYHFGAAAMSTGARGLGLVFCYQDRGNYLLFEWTGRTEKDAGARRLVAVRDGKRWPLASAKGGYRPGHWYDVSVRVSGGEVRAFVDGAPVCSCRISTGPGGRAGLYGADAAGAYFDDVWCTSNRDPVAAFTAAGSLPAVSGGMWQILGGQWKVAADQARGYVCRARTASPARALLGNATWSDYTVAADVACGAEGTAGLCFYYQGEGEHLLLRGRPGDAGVVELVKVWGEKDEVLESAGAPAAPGGSRRLMARVDRGLITAYADGRKLFERLDADVAGGRAGLFAEDCPEATFANFSVALTPRERTPVFTAHEVFEGETSMATWAAAQSDWTTTKATAEGAKALEDLTNAKETAKATAGVTETECLWHRAPFFGDVEIEAETMPAKGQLGLMVAAGDLTPASGYLLTLKGTALALSRAGTEVARASLEGVPDRVTVRLRRNGSTLIAMVGGAPRLSYRDGQALAGTRVGWYATNNCAYKEVVNVYSDNLVTDTFRQAPTDWRPAGGTWRVRNRWQCDPRWSFFSGDSFQGPAVLWHKRSFRGDITVEFAAGVRMARELGSYKDYGRDLNVTLCADGKNVQSGYSFVFAGWGNKKNAIVRQGKVVAEAPPPTLDDNIHRKWFLIRAEKRGSHLKYFVDDQLVCEYEDPQPLAGNRLALWTYRCGMVISRFRASAQGIGMRESVDGAWPAQSRTFYSTGK